MSVLSVSEHPHYVELKLNRPDKRNALNTELVDALTQSFEEYSNCDWVRLIVLTGEGDAFSAGADLESLKRLQSATLEENTRDSAQLARMFDVIYSCNKPILGAINGHALAGGCGLASMCDVTVSVPQAKFGYTETRIGFVPAIVSKFLLEKIGESRARMLLLSGSVISAEEACRIGLVTEVSDQFDDRCAYWIDLFTKQVSPEAVHRTKRLLREIPDMSVTECLDRAVVENATARMTDDCKKGITAFLNKEKVVWD